MKSILSKTNQPHIYKFNAICNKCTPDGYDEHFSIQFKNFKCIRHPDENIILSCRCCKKNFNSQSYIFHNTEKNPCQKYILLTKSKKSKIKMSKLFGQRYSISSILKSYYEEPTFPLDHTIDDFLKKFSKESNNSNLKKKISRYFEIQKKLSHNPNRNTEKKSLDKDDIEKLSEKYSSYFNKLSDIISKTQRYNTRSSKNKDLYDDICRSITSIEMKNINEYMDRFETILDKDNVRFNESNNNMKDYTDILVSLIDPLIENVNNYRNILYKQNQIIQDLNQEIGSYYVRSDKEYLNMEEIKKNEEKNKIDVNKLKKKGMLGTLILDNVDTNKSINYYNTDDNDDNSDDSDYYMDDNSNYNNNNNNQNLNISPLLLNQEKKGKEPMENN